MSNWKRKIPLALIALAPLAARADDTVTNVTTLVSWAESAFNLGLPVGLAIIGVLIGIRLVKKGLSAASGR